MPSRRKAVQFSRTGHPPDVVELVEIEIPDPGPGEIIVDIEAAPIAPSHILTLSGKYGAPPKLPAIPGYDALGTVVEVGPGVTRFRPGDRLSLPHGTGGWRQRSLVKADDVLVSFPPGGDPLQLAMLHANPPTAYLMLTRYVRLAPGDWVIQNAANSATGQYLVELAHHFGWRTVCVVRREGPEAMLKRAGADVVLVDGPDLAARVKEATGGAHIGLGIDAVAGAATARLAACLGQKGTVVNYGLLSGEPCQVPPHDIVFREITLTGFWMHKWLSEKSNAAERAQLYALLRDLVVRGVLHAEVAATYPLSKAKEAVAHAITPGRDGKILFTPQVEA
ncbi:MAG: zinc-dependent alcohol dehydrogenase family protein [Alphaproteobacteria bacterium]